MADLQSGPVRAQRSWRIKVLEAARLRAPYADEPDLYLDGIGDPFVSDVVRITRG